VQGQRPGCAWQRAVLWLLTIGQHQHRYRSCGLNIHPQPSSSCRWSLHLNKLTNLCGRAWFGAAPTALLSTNCCRAESAHGVAILQQYLDWITDKDNDVQLLHTSVHITFKFLKDHNNQSISTCLNECRASGPGVANSKQRFRCTHNGQAHTSTRILPSWPTSHRTCRQTGAPPDIHT
jgi:hypothetical protein